MNDDYMGYVKITPRFFKEMTDDEFHKLLHDQKGSLTLDQYGKAMRMNAEDRAKDAKEE